MVEPNRPREQPGDPTQLRERIDPELRPRHVAIIMDGNGRWAAARGEPRSVGHRAGAETIRRIIACCSELSIPFLTLYAFSTENWSRPREEVEELMRLLVIHLRQYRGDLHRYGLRLKAIGELDRLPPVARKALERTIRDSRTHRNGTLTLALSYGSRAEIVHAVRDIARQVAEGKLAPEQIDEERIAASLYTHDLPDPDLIIRTSGEQRLSNFLLWQASYAEMWTTRTHWPDFSREDFLGAILEYTQRKRRFGGV
jgi:undecaprenyl diphosphate synthase